MDVSKPSQQNKESLKERKELLLKIKNLLSENQELLSGNVELKQELKYKNEFLKNIPVEARNHITSIKGFVEMLINDDQSKLTDKEKKYLINVLTSSNLLNKLINDIFKIS